LHLVVEYPWEIQHSVEYSILFLRLFEQYAVSKYFEFYVILEQFDFLVHILIRIQDVFTQAGCCQLNRWRK